MNLRIVTDSSSCLPAGWAEEHGVTVIPQGVVVDGAAYRETVDLPGDDFYRLLERGATASSSQPRPEDFAAVYRAALDAGDQVLSIHIGAKLSGTLETARSQAALAQAASGGGREATAGGAGLPTPAMASDPPGHIHLVDSRSAGLGLGFLVMEAARLAREGMAPAAVAAALGDMIPRVRVCFMLHTMTYLVRGGRVGRAAGLAASLLRLRPLLGFEDGEIVPVGHTRTSRQATAQLWRLISASADRGLSYAGFHYGLNRDEVEGWRREFTDRYGIEAALTQLGPAVGVHSGPRILGVVQVEAG